MVSIKETVRESQGISNMTIFEDYRRRAQGTGHEVVSFIRFSEPG